MEDRRQFTRILLNATAYLQKTKYVWKTQLIDLSLNGALISKPPESDLSSGNIVYLGFVLPNSFVEIEMQMQVMHIDEQTIGLKCLFIDIESIGHLRNIIELNQVDPNALDREIQSVLQAQLTRQQHIKDKNKPTKN